MAKHYFHSLCPLFDISTHLGSSSNDMEVELGTKRGTGDKNGEIPFFATLMYD